MGASRDLDPQGLPGEVFGALHWDAAGLVTVVTQQHDTGEVLMVAHANADAVRTTLATGKATYWSRSRNRLWVKGEESGNFQQVVEVRVDCDGDALLYLVDSPGPACHQRRRSCFSMRLDADGSLHRVLPVLDGP